MSILDGDPYIEWNEADAANDDGQAVQDAEREAAAWDADDYDDRLMPPAREEPDDYEQAAQEHEEHCENVHGGADCDCPPAEPIDPDAPYYSDEPPF